jgi:hypothetical protein
MGKKFSRYCAGSPPNLDPDWAFEVTESSIITYRIRFNPLRFWRMRTYEEASRRELQGDMVADIHYRDGSSGFCEVRGAAWTRDYHILDEVDRFAAEVSYAVSYLPSPTSS